MPGWAPSQSQNPRSYRHSDRAGCRRSCGKVGRAIISEDPKEELEATVRPLENVPDQLKDWHPGFDEKVLDLAYPSLFPLLCSRTRVLPTGSVGLRDRAESCNKDEVAPILKDEEVKVQRLNASLRQLSLGQVKFWSMRFQWLLYDVQFAEGDKVKITSYINNLHPVHHEKLYTVIENFIVKSIPLWSGFELYCHANQSTH